jgi:hypothetical protein
MMVVLDKQHATMTYLTGEMVCVLLEDLGRGVDAILLQVILTKQLRTRLKILGRWIVHSDKNISNKRTSYDIFRDLIQT